MAGFGENKGGNRKKANQAKLAKGEYLHKKGIDYHIQGKTRSAEESYRQAIALGYEHKSTYSNLGVICQSSGREEEAILLFKKSISIDPDYSIAYMNLGSIYKELGRLDDAIDYTLKCLKRDIGNHKAYMNLGAMYRDQGNLDQALACTLKSVELQPENPTSLANLGVIYTNLGDYSRGRTYITKSLDLKPDNPDALATLGSIFSNTNEFDKAIPILEKSLTLKSTTQALITLSMIYGKLGEKGKCLKNALDALKLDPCNQDSLLNLANQYQICDEIDLGIDAALKAIRIDESSEDAYLLASRLMCTRELYSDALKLLEKSKQFIKDNHKIDGELVRLTFLKGLLDDGKDNQVPWNAEDDYYYEDCGGSNLIITFGSNGLGQNEENIPLFNFRTTLKSFDNHDKLYIRDLDRCYYMKGIKNSAPSILELKNLILKYVQSKNYDSVTTLGSSSGGFGALLYGNLIEADFMIAFNPQTVLDKDQEDVIKDDIFAGNLCKQLRNANVDDSFYQKCLNIRNFIPFHGKAVIHYSDCSEAGVDERYAKYLEHDRCVTIAHDSSTHLLAHQLKEKNQIIDQIKKSIKVLKTRSS